MKKTLIGLLLALGIVAALGQASGRFIAQWQNAGTLIGTFTSYMRMNCSTGLTCSYSGGTVTMSASGSGGAMVQLCSLTASGSTVLEFKSANCGSVVFTSTYHTYQIVIRPTTFNTTGGNLMVRFSTDNGATYDTGANYDWTIIANGVLNGFTGETTHRIFCNVATTATPGCAGTFTLYDPLSASNKKWMNGHFTSIYTNSTEVDTVESTFYNSTSAVNAMEFAAGTASGTLTGTFTGTITLYGITP